MFGIIYLLTSNLMNKKILYGIFLLKVAHFDLNTYLLTSKPFVISNVDDRLVCMVLS